MIFISEMTGKALNSDIQREKCKYLKPWKLGKGDNSAQEQEKQVPGL